MVRIDSKNDAPPPVEPPGRPLEGQVGQSRVKNWRNGEPEAVEVENEKIANRVAGVVKSR